ncbi:probable calcium-binding protein CML41 [Ziziphus jujuba]|uniref:EF-hand domain-containing protein n=2 Tax=Ziziphus jujuba TaxID=326968 RepID=A0A978UYL3_ZIZJJ|nr:probable calcium-binding protein CML41 [Ziziphus jujuba]KAH7520079.1 hypothetical protein FEM48_Zijuj08G0105700 [Ziziphus jujuba var. spinosa]
MANSDNRVSKSSKWFANKSLKLSFNGRRGSKPSSTISSPASPLSPRTPRINSGSGEDYQLRQVFSYFDGNGDGKVSALELRSYFGSVGEYMSHEEAQEVINDLDEDGDDLIDFKDFLKLMKKDAEEEDLRKAFEMFELEKGCITPKSLQRMLCRLGDAKSYDECVAMIQAFDTDGNGVVDFNEFHQMMVA